MAGKDNRVEDVMNRYLKRLVSDLEEEANRFIIINLVPIHMNCAKALGSLVSNPGLLSLSHIRVLLSQSFLSKDTMNEIIPDMDTIPLPEIVSYHDKI